MQAHVLRTKFLDYFKSKGHVIKDSDSLVPRDDPTVLFTPAGMNQFKKEFMGFLSGFKRAATSQRCLRTGDLDNVGKTRGHHTFFEMLGNFSFGDYFKKEAIGYAWEFLTAELKISPDRLWVSVHSEDDEAYAIWKDVIRVPAGKIVRMGDKDNFWPSEARAKGPNGPCGPCSEIYFDRGQESGCKDPSCSPACSCGRFLEIWNLVFTQYNRLDGGKLEPLPQKNIDTGMGLERLAAVMQNKETNFETDLFTPITGEIRRRAPGASQEVVNAVADHVRAVTFSIFDGVLPSNEARGYVVRKLIRRSVLRLRAAGVRKPFLNALVPTVAEAMKPAYAELVRRQEDIAQVIEAEEKQFSALLDSSEPRFEEKFGSFKLSPDADKVGRIVFELYDTYGIPREVTQEWLASRSIQMSDEAFQEELEAQMARSKGSSSMKGDVFRMKGIDTAAFAATKFLGYEQIEAAGVILGILREDKASDFIAQGNEGILILDQTPFYAESGGQVGDTGKIVSGENEFLVEETIKSGRVFLHKGRAFRGEFKKAQKVSACVDKERRRAIERNHTATHMLQAALRTVLGEHVQQQGSFVGEDRLRFDFTHFKSITEEELDRVEEIVNVAVIRDMPLRTDVMEIASAKESGALAFFGEKYDDVVRVVHVGDYSREVCGGTHLRASGEIGLFVIVQEGSVASGVRRIEAATGRAAYQFVKNRSRVAGDLSRAMNVPVDQVSGEVEKRIQRVRDLEKELNKQKMGELKAGIDDAVAAGEVIDGVKVITRVMDGLDMDLLRKNVDMIREKAGSAVVALGSGFPQKALLVVGVTPDLVAKGFDAGAMIRVIAAPIGGSGGGRKDFAQAGGTKPEAFAAAFGKLTDYIRGRGQLS